jgi:hypothetical protein
MLLAGDRFVPKHRGVTIKKEIYAARLTVLVKVLISAITAHQHLNDFLLI